MPSDPGTSIVRPELGRSPAEPLVGRSVEQALLRSFMDRAVGRGGALVLCGQPGVGKTALLDAAADTAAEAGVQVVRAGGGKVEADAAGFGLHQVLLPLRDELGRLSRTHQTALSVALGLDDGPPPRRLVLGAAALAALRREPGERPLLLVVDDLSWIDRPSALVLTFVARRLAGSRTGFLAGLRSDGGASPEPADVPEHEVRPLGGAAAVALLRERFPELAPRVRERILAEARGNPLALLELPAGLTGAQRSAQAPLPAVLPLSRRLKGLYADRIGALPTNLRHLLLLTALDDTGDGRVLRGTGDSGSDDLAPAERAGLVRLGGAGAAPAFPHPLIGATVVQLSTGAERRRAHVRLAELAADEPERRAWHLAGAALGPDEQVAAQLEQSAGRVRGRGDGVGAVALLLRAAQLSAGGPDRARRLVEAAFVGSDVTGDLRGVPQLLVEARRADPGLDRSPAAIAAAAYAALNVEGDVNLAYHLLMEALKDHRVATGADEHAADVLHTLLLVCFFGGRTERWEPFHAALAGWTGPVPDVLLLSARTFADPVGTPPAVLDALDTAIAALPGEVDPARIVRIGIAAFHVDRLAGCREAFWRVVRDGRSGGAVASAVSGLLLLAFDQLASGSWTEADTLAQEGLQIGQEHGYRLLSWPGWYALALLAAARGDDVRARELTEEMTRWAVPRGVRAVQMYAWHAGALAALGRGDAEDAYQQATAISPAGSLPSHVPLALWVVMDVVESAVRTGRAAEATAHVAAVRAAGVAQLSPRLALVAAGAAALAAPPARAAGLYEQALALPGNDRWPFDLARVQLYYGEHLRRARAATASRVQLTAALDTFDRLGARPWSARARTELRATGQTRSAGAGSRSALTPQEQCIAELAASGLSNKEIGQQLRLSHRTIAAHLRLTFPKLGVATRAALRDALSHVDPTA